MIIPNISYFISITRSCCEHLFLIYINETDVVIIFDITYPAISTYVKNKNIWLVPGSVSLILQKML